MKVVYLNRLAKGAFLFFVFLIAGIGSLRAQCPAMGACTNTITSSSTATISLSSGQYQCITGGTYAGNVNGIPAGATLYVGSGAIFNPTGMGSIKGTLINCGTARIPNMEVEGNGTTSAGRIENYGVMNFVAGTGYKGTNAIVNGLNAKMVFNGGQTLTGTTIDNKGSIRIIGDLTTNSDNVLINNEDSLTTTGSISLNGRINNTGYLFANGSSLTLNANGVITNGCYFISEGDFVYNGNSTSPLIITGFIWSRGNSVKTNGSGILQLSGEGFLQGADFENNGTVRGTGNFYFSGTTKNQGPFGQDGGHLNFYDASLPTNPLSTLFDQQVQNPHSSATKTAISPKDNTSFVPGTCSQIIIDQYCDVAAGPDISVCNVSTANLPDAKASQSWSFLPAISTAPATIHATTGEVSNMNQAGDYYFLLSKPLVATCKDTVKVTRFPIPPAPKVTGPQYACQNGSATLPDSVTYVWYTVPTNGVGVSPAPTVNTATVGTISYYVSRRVNGCESARIRYDVIVNASPNASLIVKGSSVCPTAASATVTIEGTKANERYQAYEGGVAKGNAVVSPSNNATVTLTLLLGTGTAELNPTVRDHIINVSASIPGCNTPVSLTDTALVMIKIPKTAGLVLSATSPICSASPNNLSRITITPAEPGVTYTIYDSTALVGTITSTANGRLFAISGTGRHILNATARFSDCSTSFPLTDTALVWVNKLPSATVSLTATTPICITGQTRVTVVSSEVGVVYSIYANDSLLGTIPGGPNSFQDFTLKRVGNNVISAIARIGGCGDVALTSRQTVLVNRVPSKTPSVTASGPICQGQQTRVEITGVEAGVKYRIYDVASGKLLDSIIAPANFKLVTMPDAGLRTLRISAQIGGCGVVDLDARPTVQVNVGSTVNLPVTYTNPICEGDTVSITITSTQNGVTYQVLRGTTPVTNALVANGNPLTFKIPNLLAGTYTFTITANTPGCGATPLTSQPVVTVNPKLNGDNLLLTGSTVCSNSDTANVTVRNTQAGVSYQAIVKGIAVGRPVTSPLLNATIVLRLPVTQLELGTNTINISGTIGGCGTVIFANKTTTVVKNPLPDGTTWTLVGDTICANSTSARIIINNTQAGVSYQAVLKGGKVGNVVLSTGLPVTLTIPRAALTVGANWLHVAGNILGCVEVVSKDSAQILVNPIPDINLKVIGDTVCSNATFGHFTIFNTKASQTYQALFKGNPIGAPGTSTADGSNVILNLPVTLLDVGNNSISARVSIKGCTTLVLNNSANVRVNQNPINPPTVRGDTICSDSVQARLYLTNAQTGVTYSVFKGAVLVGKGTANGTSLSIPINAIGFGIGANSLTLKGFIPGCDTAVYTIPINVYVNPRPNYNLSFSATGPVCIGGFSTITINNAENNVLYKVFDNNDSLGTILGKGVTVSQPFSMKELGDRIITIRAFINGCSEGPLNGKDTVTVNKGSEINLDITANSPVCVGNPIFVNVPTSDPAAVYKVILNNVVVSDSLQGDTRTIRLKIDSLPAGIHNLRVIGNTAGCGNFQIKDDSLFVTVDDKLDAGLKVIGSTVCSTSDTATVKISGVKKRQIYSAYLGATKLAEDSMTKDGDIVLYVLVKDLKVGLNKINFKAKVGGCVGIDLRDSASILVNPIPDVNLAMTDDTVCRNSTFASVSVIGTRGGETYYAFLDNTPLDTVLSPGGTIVLSIPVDSLATSPTLNSISVKVFIAGCGLQTINGNSFITVNPLPSDTLPVIGDTVCSGATFAHVTIKSTLTNQIFQAYLDNHPIGLPKKSTGGEVVLDIPVQGTLAEGPYEISIKATIRGCDSVLLKNIAKLLIGAAPQPTLTVIGDTVCTNSDTATVQILGTKISESYVARINGVTISDSVISKGGTVTLKIPVSKLPKDTNEVTVYTNVIGCGEAPLSNKAWIIINQLPSDTLKVVGDTVCENSTEAIVTVRNTTKNVIYSAWLNGALVSNTVTSTGGDVSLKLPIAGLALDTNKIAVLASINGCADVPLKDSALVIVNKKPTLSVSVLGSVVCSTADSATVTIVGSDKGAVYQALLNGGTLGQPIVGTGANVVLKLPVAGLAFDTNLVSVSVTVSGCGSSLLDGVAKVVVNKLPSDSLSTDGSTACRGSLSASVTVYNSQRNVGYQAFLGNDTVGTVVLGTGGTIQLPVFVNKLKVGINKVTVKTSLEQCNIITLKDTALVVVNDNGGADSAIVEGSSVCYGQDAFVKLSKSQVGITYHLYIRDQPTNLKVVGTGKTDTLWIKNSLNLLANGPNKVSFSADIPSCNTVYLTSTSTVFILRDPGAKLSGDDLLCYGGVGHYNVSLIPGAKYHWVVGDSAKILFGQGSQVVDVQFDSVNSYVAVMPVGDLGICHQDSIGKFVTIKAPIHGKADVTGRDTVCTGDVDTIQVVGQRGVLYYSYELPKGVDYRGKIDTDSASDSLVVRYTRAGWVTWLFYPYSECAQKIDSSSVVVWKVRVIGTPVAEANEYDQVEDQMFVGTANVPLDGRGSSVGDSISFKWSTEKGIIAQIENSTSQNGAVLNTAAKQIKVYLTVTNIQGLCPVVDSAIIKLNFDLDIPNVFSPNNDGVHDTWEIKNITTFYPKAIVEVFNKWGSLVWRSDEGYHTPWDGKRNGEDMPVATYYCIVDKKNGTQPYVRSVTIIR